MGEIMKRFSISVTLLVVLLTNISVAMAAISGSKPDKMSGKANQTFNEVLVHFKADQTEQARALLRKSYAAELISQDKQLMEHWRLPVMMDQDKVLASLKQQTGVDFAEPNLLRRPMVALPNDVMLGQQWAIRSIGQAINSPDGVIYPTPGADLGLMAATAPLTAAWNTTSGNNTIIIAVIDDSVDINHPDLQANIWTNAGEIPGNGVDDDGNGYIDDIHGWDFVNNDNDPSADVKPAGSEEGHGTAVAGVIGAVGNNFIGVSGVMQSVSIMPLKFGGDVASELAAMKYAADNYAQIVNLSWGGPQFSKAESGGIQYLQNAGVLVVAAAGNEDISNDFVQYYPAGLPNSNIISVAASDHYSGLLSISQYGPTSVDIAAPGLDIYTTMSPYGSVRYGDSKQTGLYYDYIVGSSFSAPYVAGIAGLIRTQNPVAIRTYQDMKGAILASARAQTSMQGRIATGGTAYAAAALPAALTPAPVLLIRSVAWQDNNNGWPEAGETAFLDIQIENAWNPASGITAKLTSLSTNLTITSPTASYPNLAQDAYASPTTLFQAQVSPTATSYETFRLRLDIYAGLQTTTRYYEIGQGSLSKGVTYAGTLMKNAYDDAQFFHLTVPNNIMRVTLNTTSATDVDLLVSTQHPPQFGYYSLPTSVDSYTQAAATKNSGNESLSISTTASKDVYVAVVDASKFGTIALNYNYTVTANYSAPPVITLTGANPMSITSGTAFTDPGSTVTDDVDAGLTATVTGTVNTAVVGTYTLTYSVTDSDGNLVTALRTVNVTAAPVVAAPAAAATAPAAGGKGGCTLSRGNAFDPVLPMLALLSVFYWFRRKQL